MRSNYKKPIFASSGLSVLGVYEGEVLDSNITNKNGLDITADVIRCVLSSEDYKSGIENGWFIGFLGHPEDPNCMDFKSGCIVMTDMRIEESGKVYGTFNLIDTPVGRIVKAFIDAGVKFGISIRGAGDIINNSVDPESFVFRGFDLVSFPAYPESIPTYTAIAASQNMEDRAKYQAICASIRSNVGAIESTSTLTVLQEQIAPQSDEYRMVTDQIEKITSSSDISVDMQKINAMTDLYLSERERSEILSAEVASLKSEIRSATHVADRKYRRIKQIMGAQLQDALRMADVAADTSKNLKQRIYNLGAQLADAKDALKCAENNNLIYHQRIEAKDATINRCNQTILGLRSELSETVAANERLRSGVSNRDRENVRLQNRVTACEKLIQEYQAAYVSLYAGALGVNPTSVSVTASTSVADVKRQVEGATNTSSMPAECEYSDFEEPLYSEQYPDDDALITL